MPYLMTVVVLTLISMRNRAGLNAPAIVATAIAAEHEGTLTYVRGEDAPWTLEPLDVADLAREYGFTDVDGRVVEAFEIDGNP